MKLVSYPRAEVIQATITNMIIMTIVVASSSSLPPSSSSTTCIMVYNLSYTLACPLARLIASIALTSDSEVFTPRTIAETPKKQAADISEVFRHCEAFSFNLEIITPLLHKSVLCGYSATIPHIPATIPHIIYNDQMLYTTTTLPYCCVQAKSLLSD